ncbi:PEP/pyruvate-binding domain-containing protein [Zooshikella harenae]|uniref:Phosphoenolpyruvate synthase n=1 Tax=Zooshikella harenae TaxID=2827238 RepID=A0ABS5ZD23_9GAMM|nr:PEP/pyruvate-binding domain-containing protein [Zooshikella harenae]MBU2711763.1 phosphoenolpyruvate synthase [Zooshikella harenae]
MSSQKYVIALTGKKDFSKSEIGGKAVSLNKLVKNDFLVPEAYCITTDAYEYFLNCTGIYNLLEKQAINTIKVEEIVKEIDKAKIPSDLVDEILKVYKNMGQGQVAIRSSAVNEDGLFQSYAGQYETYLYVNSEAKVLECVRRCWKSLWAMRATLYHAKHDINIDDCKIAVVIQKMVDADAAGVAFSQDPVSGDESYIIIDACWGVGEGVVSGQVITDSYRISKSDYALIGSEIREKKLKCARKDNGETHIVSVDNEYIKKQVLSAQQYKKLAKQVVEISQYYNQAMDIEWGVENNELYILQARPITSKLSDAITYFADENETDPYIRDNALFSRMDTGEIVTGLMSPLGLSFCKFYQHNIHGPAIKTMGLLDIGNSQHYMGYIQGQVYLNISASAMLLSQCPPTRDLMKFTKRYATDDIDFTGYCNPYGEPVTGWTLVKSSLYWFSYQIYNLFTAERIVNKMIKMRQDEIDRFYSLDLKSMSLSELNDELARIDKYFLKACKAYMPFFLQSFALYDLLAELCEKWLEGKGEGLQNRIKASMNSLRTIEVTRGIYQLTEKVNTNPDLRTVFINSDADCLQANLESSSVGSHFINSEFAGFLNKYGTRGRQEFELSIPRWNDDPSYLLKVIKMYLVSDVRLEEKIAEVDKERVSDTEILLKKLPLFTRLKFRFVIAAYAKMAERREDTRPTYIAETWFYRKITTEVLSRLDNDNIVSKDDLPFIDFNLFRKYVSGKINVDEAFSRELIDKNKKDYLINRNSEEPPMAIIGGYKPRTKKVETSPTDIDVIKGVGASPGIVVARARVINDLDKEAATLQQGEILVAKFTDASWTPLFVLAAGVIADIGSMLSHSSIVSREFGIPAVVNTKVACLHIKTGDILYLDGNNGEVRIQTKVVNNKLEYEEALAI